MLPTTKIPRLNSPRGTTSAISTDLRSNLPAPKSQIEAWKEPRGGKKYFARASNSSSSGHAGLLERTFLHGKARSEFRWLSSQSYQARNLSSTSRCLSRRPGSDVVVPEAGVKCCLPLDPLWLFSPKGVAGLCTVTPDIGVGGASLRMLSPHQNTRNLHSIRGVLVDPGCGAPSLFISPLFEPARKSSCAKPAEKIR